MDPSALNRDEWKNSDYKRSLILSLKDKCRDLMPYLHRQEISYLTEDNMIEVRGLIDILEMIFFNGIKIKEFSGQIPLWGLLERLEVISPPCIPLRNSVGAVACIESLRTPLAKARSWIRQSLNAQSLEASLVFMGEHRDWLAKFYYPEALLMSKEELNMLVAVVRSLKVLSFSIDTASKHLNGLTPQINAIITSQTAFVPNTPSNNSNSTGNVAAGGGPSQKVVSRPPQPPANNSGGGSGFDFFFKAFEEKLDKIVNTVDNFISSVNLNNDFYPGNANLGRGDGDDDNEPGSTVMARRLVPFFASSMRDLLLDEGRSPMALICPEIGLPRQVLLMLTLLSQQLSTPGLFRQRLPIAQVEDIRRTLEAEKLTPNSQASNVHLLSFTLIKWLGELPEPLLGYEHYAALLACQEIEDKQDRVRNLTILVREMPWYHRVLTLELLALLNKALKPEYSSKNGLNAIAVALLVTSFFLRPRQGRASSQSQKQGTQSSMVPDGQAVLSNEEERESFLMSVTANGSALMEFLLAHSDDVFAPVKEELNQRQLALNSKLLRLGGLQELLNRPFDLVMVLDANKDSISKGDNKGGNGKGDVYLDYDQSQLFRELWMNLAGAEKILSFVDLNASDASTPIGEARVLSNDSEDANAAVPDLKTVSAKSEKGLSMYEIFADLRWDICGFKTVELPIPLSEFNIPSGYLALQSFLTFLKKYQDQASNIIYEFCQKRKKFCRLSQVVIRLTTFVADVLYLTPPSNSVKKSPHAPLAAASVGNITPISPVSSKLSGLTVGGSNISPSVQYIAKSPAWHLLNDEKSFQECFDLAFICFNESWKDITERIGEVPTHETFSQVLFRTRAVLWEIIYKRPATIKHVWDLWTQIRAVEEEKLIRSARQSKLVAHHQQQQQKQLAEKIQNSIQSNAKGQVTSQTQVYPDMEATASPILDNNKYILSYSKPSAKIRPSLSPPTQSTSQSVATQQTGSNTLQPTDLNRDMYSVKGEADSSSGDDEDEDDAFQSSGDEGLSSKRENDGTTNRKSYLSQLSGSISSLTGRGSKPAGAMDNTKQLLGDIDAALYSPPPAKSSGKVDEDGDDSDSDEETVTRKKQRQHSVKVIPAPTNASQNVADSSQSTGLFEEIDAFLNSTSNVSVSHGGHVIDNDGHQNLHIHEIVPSSGSVGSLERQSCIKPSTSQSCAVSSAAGIGSDSIAMRHYEDTGEMNEYVNARVTEAEKKRELAVIVPKSFMGIQTKVIGGSKILSPAQIEQLEAALPSTHQCYDWKLLYRLSLHGASASTLLHQARNFSHCILIVQDSNGTVFGAFVTETMKVGERDKYYGNGTMGVWTFASGALKFYSWSFKNNYFMITSKECLAFGGGGRFAIYLDSDLNRGTSGGCQTFNSPCLASEEEFHCISCELFGLQAAGI